MPVRPYNHERIHDSQAIEDCRNRRNSTFRSCVEALPEMGEILSGCGEIGWKAFGKRCCEYLMGSLGEIPGIADRNLKAGIIPHGRTDFIGGDEHYISLPDSDTQDRVFKWTYGDNFGLCLKVFEIDPDGMPRGTSESKTEPSFPSMPSRSIPAVRRGIGVSVKRNAVHDRRGGLHQTCQAHESLPLNGMPDAIRRHKPICHH